MEESKELETAMKIISHSGNAKSIGMEAIQSAKNGDFETARIKLEEANQEILQAHRAQTNLIQYEASGEKVQLNLLLIHAQDHLMTAMTLLDLVKELVELYKRVRFLKCPQ